MFSRDEREAMKQTSLRQWQQAERSSWQEGLHLRASTDGRADGIRHHASRPCPRFPRLQTPAQRKVDWLSFSTPDCQYLARLRISAA